MKMKLYEMILKIIKKNGPGTFHYICNEVNKYQNRNSMEKKPLNVSHIKSVVSRKKDLFAVYDDVVYIRDELDFEYLTVTISNYPRPTYKVYVDFIKNRFFFYEWCIDSRPETRNQHEVQIGNVAEFKQELLPLEIWKWKRDYQLEELVLDGTSWSVQLKTRNYLFESEGLQAFPENWDEFCQAITKLIGFRFI